ncbi:hypothetical protein IT398_02055 [Candidatus Nomurabacteria bacterium]|nr:hypothetical protein [Candidatus Nomurabacteria bacterium]
MSTPSTKKSLRFGIVDDSGLRAATWNLRYQVSNKTGLPEVYLLCRELRGDIHASMHPSGKWHVAYPEEVFARNIKDISPEGTDRFIQKWIRPKEIKPGITLAFRIITPFSAVKTKIAEDEKEFFRIAKAPNGKATNIMILFVSPDANLYTIKGSEVIGRVLLNNGEKVIAIHEVIDIVPPFTEKHRASPRYLKGKSKSDLSGPDLKAIIFGDASDGSRVIWDCAVNSSLD